MSLLLWNDPLDILARPSQLLDQHFGVDLEPEDFLAPLVPREFRRYLHCPAGYLRPWRSQESQRDVGSVLKCDKEKFEASLDVSQFKPEEITVKVTGDNMITVEGKHEEQQDDKGYISRHFVRRYVVPKQHDLKKVESKLSSDGVLTITAPRTDAIEVKDVKTVPIQHTGEAVKAVKDKSKEEKK